MKLSEGDLEIDFTDAINGFVFDQMKPELPDFHGIAAMHRVDFVVEVEDAIIFVEVKDPCNPKARSEGLEKFNGGLEDGTLSDTFVSKFIDSFLYRWAEREINKQVYYINLVTLDAELLPNFGDEIFKKLPPMGKAVPRWKRQVVENCQVFNIETWNENFPKWPVIRRSEVISSGRE